jgi:molybdenum storage protein
MSRIIIGEGLNRTDIDTPFRELSFTTEEAEKLASGREVVRILPDVKVVKIGGQSFMDRGAEAVLPLVEEIVALQRDGHQMLLGVGGGTRARHAYAVGLDLGMPTQVMAKLGVSVPMQNARMLQMLLAKHGGIMISHDDFYKLPLYYKLGCMPILPGMPPFEYWEKPAKTGRIPANRTDAGVFLTAEALGAHSCIFVKDEKGLYTDNPKADRNATFIPRIHAQELLDRNLADLVLEKVVVDYLLNADLVREVQIINGLERGNLTRALQGEHVGTIIYAD